MNEQEWKNCLLTAAKFSPVLLWSPPGCGKSQAVEAWALQRYGIGYDEAMTKYSPPEWARKIFDHHRPVVEQMLSEGCYPLMATDDPVDVCGVLIPSGGATVRQHPLYWVVAAHIPICVFCEELTAGTAEQRAAQLRASDDKRSLHGMPLHPMSRVIGAANPPEFAAGSARELTAPELSRWRHYQITGKEAVAWMNGEEGIRLEFPNQPPLAQMPRIGAAYLRKNPGAALATAEMIRQAIETQSPWPCPRQWWRAWNEEGDLTKIGEYVGGSAAGAFLNWYNVQDLTDPVEILAGRDKTVPKKGDAAMATAAGVAGLLGGKPSDEALAHALDWFRLAAEKGHAGNCRIDLDSICKAVGTTRVSRYGKELAPYASMLRLAGTLN